MLLNCNEEEFVCAMMRFRHKTRKYNRMKMLPYIIDTFTEAELFDDCTKSLLEVLAAFYGSSILFLEETPSMSLTLKTQSNVRLENELKRFEADAIEDYWLKGIKR